MKTLKEMKKDLRSRGAKEVRPEVWVHPEIYSNSEMTQLHEFDTEYLHWLMRKEALGWAGRQASQKGLSVLKYHGMYMKIKPRKIRLMKPKLDVKKITELTSEAKKRGLKSESMVSRDHPTQE